VFSIRKAKKKHMNVKKLATLFSTIWNDFLSLAIRKPKTYLKGWRLELINSLCLKGNIKKTKRKGLPKIEESEYNQIAFKRGTNIT
jgi:hypothetical protein